MTKDQFIKKAEEIINDTTEKPSVPCPANLKFTHWAGKSNTKSICYQCGQECYIAPDTRAKALYQLHLEGVREIIGEDEKPKAYGVEGQEIPKAIYDKIIRNELRREQSEKLKK